MKIETSLVLELDSFVALRCKSYSYSYTSCTEGASRDQKESSRQKGIQKTPKIESYITS